MRTDIILSDNTRLRVHYCHLRENFGDNLSEVALEYILDAFQVGQIDDYRIHGVSEYGPLFESVLHPSAITVCEATSLEKDEDGRNKIVARGVAFCSRQDQFNKSLGRKIAFNRTINDLLRQGFEIVGVDYRS